LVAGAELAGDMSALKSQQRRWTKGSIQTARKLLPAVLGTSRRRALRIEAFVHLTSNLTYPLLLVLGLLLLPVLLGAPEAPAWVAWTVQGGVWVFGVIPTLLFLAVGQREAGMAWRRIPRDVACTMLLGVGLSLNNTRAVLEACMGDAGAWDRTPKTGDRDRQRGVTRGYSSSGRMMGAGELSLAAYFGSVAV